MSEHAMSHAEFQDGIEQVAESIIRAVRSSKRVGQIAAMEGSASMSASPREHLRADQWREIAYAKHYGRTGYEAHDMYDAVNLLLGEIALLRDERDAAMTDTPREPTDAAIDWGHGYAAGVRDQEAEDFAELNHMSTQCDRVNEVAANAEERCERVVKALAGLLDAWRTRLEVPDDEPLDGYAGFYERPQIRKAEAALKEAQDGGEIMLSRAALEAQARDSGR